MTLVPTDGIGRFVWKDLESDMVSLPTIDFNTVALCQDSFCFNMHGGIEPGVQTIDIHVDVCSSKGMVKKQ